MVNDPIADLLTRIRNGGMVRKEEVAVPHSRAVESVLSVLLGAGFIAGYDTREDGPRKELIIRIKYSERGRHVIEGSRRVSSSSRRIYVSSRDLIKWIKGRNYLGIVSTSQGIMSHRQAMQKNLGGELMGLVWS